MIRNGTLLIVILPFSIPMSSRLVLLWSNLNQEYTSDINGTWLSQKRPRILSVKSISVRYFLIIDGMKAPVNNKSSSIWNWCIIDHTSTSEDILIIDIATTIIIDTPTVVWVETRALFISLVIIFMHLDPLSS